MRRSWVVAIVWLVSLAVLAACSQVEAPSDLDAMARPTVDSYVVVLNPAFAPGSHAANRAQAADIARGLGLAPAHAYGTALFGFSAAIPQARLNGLLRDPRVLYVDRDGPVSLPAPAAPPCWVTGTCDGGGDDPATGQVLPWGVDRIDADLNTNEGSGIHVYILDTGIDADHADLQANLGNGYAVESCKGGSCAAAWDDDHDHGTHVAGTVGAIDNDIDVVGVASQVTLHAVKVLAKNGSGTRSGVIAGVDWVAKEVKARGAAAVANMSLGGSGSKTGSCTTSGFTGSDAYHQSICNATRAGVVFVVAAGNSGADAAGAVPAAYDDTVITVSATKEGDDWTSWSNWGDANASWTANASAPVAIAAPGASILSTKRGGGTTTMSGTSMASPHGAGAAAMYLANNTQTNDYTAFSNTRSGLLGSAESTDGFSNTSGNPHDEDFLDAGGL